MPLHHFFKLTHLKGTQMKALTQFLSRYSVDALRIMSGVSLLNLTNSFIQDTEFLSSFLWSGPLPFVFGALCMFFSSEALPEQLWALNLAPLMFISFLSLIVFGHGEFAVDRLIGLETESMNSTSDNDSGECRVVMLSSSLAENGNLKFARRLAV